MLRGMRAVIKLRMATDKSLNLNVKIKFYAILTHGGSGNHVDSGSHVFFSFEQISEISSRFCIQCCADVRVPIGRPPRADSELRYRKITVLNRSKISWTPGLGRSWSQM
jgi:hypothetical protein